MRIRTLATRQDCLKLQESLRSDHAIALWATGVPVPSVELMLHFKKILESRQHKVILFVRTSGVKMLQELAPDFDRDTTFHLESANIMRYCEFIKLIFTHDYCLAGEFYKMPCRICLFPHNSSYIYPVGTDQSLYSDYIIYPQNPRECFPFSAYPNSIKANGVVQKLLPGNPKYDILYNKTLRSPEEKIIAYYPTLTSLMSSAFNLSSSVIYRHTKKLIEDVLQKYPDYAFVLRPRVEDFNVGVYCRIADEFKKNELFIYDTQHDNYYFLARCSIFITSYSSIYNNYSIVRSKPAIDFRFNTRDELNIKKEDDRYIAGTASDVLTCMDEILQISTEARAMARQSRDGTHYMFGRTLHYLAENVENMINGEKISKEIVFDKCDSPSATVRDWLILITKATKSGIKFSFPMPHYIRWALEQHIHDQRIALATLRFILVKYANLDYMNGLLISNIYSEIYRALDLISRDTLLRFISFYAKKFPDNVLLVSMHAALLAHRSTANCIDLQALKNTCFELRSVESSIQIAQLLRKYMPTEDIVKHIGVENITSLALPRQTRNICINAGLLYEYDRALFSQFVHNWISKHSGQHFTLHISRQMFVLMLLTCSTKKLLDNLFWGDELFPGEMCIWTHTTSQHDINTVITKIEERFHELPEFHSLLAELYSYHDIESSIQSMHIAIELEPTSGYLQNKLCNYLLQVHKKEEARRLVEHAIANTPDNAWAWMQRADTLEREGNIEAAIAKNRMALSLNKNDSSYMLHLCRRLLIAGNCTESRRICLDTLKRCPNETRFHVLLAEVCLQQGQEEAARRHTQQSLRTTPYALDTIKALLEFYHRHDWFDELFHLCNYAFELSENIPWVHAFAARYFMHGNNGNMAIRHIEKALAIHKNNEHYVQLLDDCRALCDIA